MPAFAPDRLEGTSRRLLMAAGATAQEAECVAGRLVESNLMGHHSHGVIRLPQYLAAIERGEIVPGADFEIVSETAASAVLDGHWGFGQLIATRAVGIAVEKARSTGVAAVTIRRANHIGRLGSYVEEVAGHGMIGMLFCNAHGAGVGVAPWGGRSARIATNPIAAAVPMRTTGETASGRSMMVLDMTTSVVAEGRVRVKRNRGEPTPEGWILDAEGKPTTNPDDFYGPPRGSILPFGGSQSGYKGYGLGVVVDLLAGALSGAGTTRKPGARVGNAALLIVVDIEQFAPREEFAQSVCELADFVKSSALMDGFEEIVLPGELEQRQMASSSNAGVFIEDETWKQITDLEVKLRAGTN